MVLSQREELEQAMSKGGITELAGVPGFASPAIDEIMKMIASRAAVG